MFFIPLFFNEQFLGKIIPGVKRIIFNISVFSLWYHCGPALPSKGAARGWVVIAFQKVKDNVTMWAFHPERDIEMHFVFLEKMRLRILS